MIIPADHIVLILSCTAAPTMLLCAIVVWLGGWNWLGEEHHSTRLQKIASLTMALSALTIYLYSFTAGLRTEPSSRWTTLLVWLDYLPLSFFPLQAIILRQKKVRWTHMLISFGLLALLLVAILIWGNTYPTQLSYAGYVVYAYLLIVYFLALLRLRRWDRHILEEYSEVSHKMTTWFRHLTLPFVLLVLLWIPMTIFPSASWLMAVYYLLEIVFTVVISAYVLKQEEFDFSDPEDEPEPAVAPTKEEPEWAVRLEKAMSERHLYRDPNLTSTMLAMEAGTNRTYLSYYIKEKTNGTFYDYVNNYRLQEAKTLLSETNDSIEDISARCGFSSRRLFSRIFKEATGLTPRDYRNAQQLAPRGE